MPMLMLMLMLVLVLESLAPELHFHLWRPKSLS
jgi:hypothetical protein